MTELIPLSKLYYYETLGRTLAEGTSIRRIGELANWLDETLYCLNVLGNFFGNVAKLVALHDEQKGEFLENVSYSLISTYSIFIAKLRHKIVQDLRSDIADPRMTIDEYFQYFGDMLYVMANEMLKKEVCPECRRLVGQGCCWHGEYNTPRALINDATAIFHRIIELYIRVSQEFGDIQTLSDKSRYSSTASEVALNVLRLWDTATQVSKDLYIYDPSDYAVLTGFAFDNMVELRVGSASGHLTKIDLNAGVVDYYDTDVPVVLVLGKLFSRIGGELKKHDYDHAIYTFPLDRSEDVAFIMALATSMDFRVDDGFDDIWARLFFHTADYETYLVTGNDAYLGTAGMHSIEDARRLDYENFIGSILSGYFSGFFGVLSKVALHYIHDHPEALKEVKAKLESIWRLGDEIYRTARDSGVTKDFARARLGGGSVYAFENELTKFIRQYYPDLYLRVTNEIFDFIAMMHWYYILEIRRQFFRPPRRG